MDSENSDEIDSRSSADVCAENCFQSREMDDISGDFIFPTLKTLSAKACGKHCFADEIGDIISQLAFPEELLKEVLKFSFPQHKEVVTLTTKLVTCNVLKDFEEFFNKGILMTLYQIGFCILGEYKEYKSQSPPYANIRIYFERQRITNVNCSKCSQNMWCRHIYAAIMYRIEHQEQIQIMLPLSQNLKKCSKDQLEEIILKIALETPHAIMPICPFIGSETKLEEHIHDFSYDNEESALDKCIITRFNSKLADVQRSKRWTSLLCTSESVFENIIYAIVHKNEESALQLLRELQKFIVEPENDLTPQFKQNVIIPLERILACLVVSRNLPDVFKENIVEIAENLCRFFEVNEITFKFQHESVDYCRLYPKKICEQVFDFDQLDSPEASMFDLPSACFEVANLMEKSDCKQQSGLLFSMIKFESLYLLQHDDRNKSDMFESGLELLNTLSQLCLKFSVLSTIAKVTDPGLGPSPPKKPKTELVRKHNSEMLQNQLSLAILGVVYRIVRSLPENYDAFNLPVLLKCSMIAIELSRLRQMYYVQNQVPEEQYDYFVSVEESIIQYLLDKSESPILSVFINELVDEYTEALLKQESFDFFGNCPPLCLVYLLGKLTSVSPRLSQSHNILTNHSLPAKLMLSWDDSWLIPYKYLTTKEYVRHLVKKVISPKTPDNQEQKHKMDLYYEEALRKIADKEMCNDFEYKTIVSDTLLDHIDDIDEPKGFMIKLLFKTIVGMPTFLQPIKLGRIVLKYQNTVDSITFLKMFLPFWENIIFPLQHEQQTIIAALQKEKQNLDEYQKLIFDYLGNDTFLKTEISCDLLHLIPSNKKENAIDIVMKNFQFFTPTALFKYAKVMQKIEDNKTLEVDTDEPENRVEYDENSNDSDLAVDSQLSVKGLKLIKFAFEQAQKCAIQVPFGDIKWLEQKIAHVVSNDMLSDIICCFIKNQSCFSISAFLDFFHELLPMIDLSKHNSIEEVFENELYNIIFEKHIEYIEVYIIGNSTRIHKSIINSVESYLQKSINYCKNSMKNGQKHFKLRVIEPLKKKYANKNSFKRMLNGIVRQFASDI